MLRVGVALDSLEPSAWIASALERIQASPFARIELVLLRAGGARSGFSLFRAYEAWDYRRNRGEQDALAPVSVASVLDRIPRIECEATKGCGAESTAKLDLLLDFCKDSFLLDAANAPRHGVWRLRTDLDFSAAMGRGGSWDALELNPVCAHSLNLAGAGGEDCVLYGSAATMERTSLYRSRNPILWKNAQIVVRALERLATRGEVGCVDAETPVPPYRRPRTFETMQFLARHLRERAPGRVRQQDARPEHKWHIALRKRIEGRGFDDPDGYALMPCPDDRFYADPFLFEWQGRTWLFFEDLPYAEGRALISCCEVDEEGNFGEPFEVLRRPYHLSYPFVFEDSGEIYMIPESRSNRTVELYRATGFPHGWVQEGPLMKDVNAVDATIHRQDGRYWMFAGISDGRFSNSDEVSLFFAETLKGPWRAHPMNPVISDVRRARPAGKLFMDGGRLIRPSQDCSLAYGYALLFSEVVKMTETEYEERVVARIEPTAFARGVANHTYNRTERFEVVDRDLPRDAAIRGK
jgi:hypothetical protein